MERSRKFLIWIMLAAAQGFAQELVTLSGRVVEEGTGRPVPEARVMIAGTSRQVVTGQDGTFEFPGLAGGTYALHVTRVGYSPAETDVALRGTSGSRVSIEIREIPYFLDPVTSTATRTLSRASEVSTSVSVIPAAELEQSQALDVSDAIQDVPGVFIRPYGALGDVRTASIRGSSAGQVLVLLDGQRLNNTQSGELDLTTLPTEGIDRIEIVRGGASALYGADAVGGVVNVITKDRNISEGIGGNVKALSGSFGMRGAEVRGEYAGSQTSSALSYRYLKSEGDFNFHPTPGSTVRRANADFSSHVLFAKQRWDVNDDRAFSFTGQYVATRAGDPGTIAFPNARARKQNRNLMLGLAYDEELAGAVQRLHVQTYYHNLLFNYEDPLAYIPILNNSHNIAAGAEAQAGVHVSDWNSLTAGYAYRWDGFCGTSLQGEFGRGLHSLYVLDEIAVRPAFMPAIQRIALIPALRWDRFSDFGAQVSPKLGLVVNAGEQWLLSLKANFGRSFRAPTFNDLYWPRDAYTAGNSDLKAERATDFDAGLALEFPSLAAAGASFTWFGSNVTDMILWEPGADWVWSPRNVGKAEIRGIETGVTINPWKGLVTLGWNYTHLDARSRSGGPGEINKKLPDRPSDMHKVTLRTRHQGLYGSVDLQSAGLRYTTASNTRSLPSYKLVDLLIGYAWEMAPGRLDIKAEMRNAGDAEVQVMEGYPVPGREVRVSVSFGLGLAAGE